MQICGSLTILWHCLSLGLENENQPFPVLWLTPWRSPGLNTGMGSPSLLQGVFPTQGSNPGLPYCGQILYHLSHKGSPRILECSLSLLQQIFPTQESNRGLLHCSWIFFYQLSYQESLRPVSSKNHITESYVSALFHMQSSFPCGNNTAARVSWA